MCKELAQYVNIYSYDATTRGTRRRSLRCAASFHVAALSRSWRARRKIHAQRDPRGDGVCVCVCHPLGKGFSTATSFTCLHFTTNSYSQGPSPSPVADGQRRGHWGGLQTYLPNCCTSCHSTLSLFVSMVVHATSPKPFPSPLARVVVAPLQMRNLNVKTPSSLWTFHHAVPSPSFPSWESR